MKLPAVMLIVLFVFWGGACVGFKMHEHMSQPAVRAIGIVVSRNGLESHCYVPGEAHNELMVPCVTIEP